MIAGFSCGKVGTIQSCIFIAAEIVQVALLISIQFAGQRRPFGQQQRNTFIVICKLETTSKIFVLFVFLVGWFVGWVVVQNGMIEFGVMGFLIHISLK